MPTVTPSLPVNLTRGNVSSQEDPILKTLIVLYWWHQYIIFNQLTDTTYRTDPVNTCSVKCVPVIRFILTVKLVIHEVVYVHNYERIYAYPEADGQF